MLPWIHSLPDHVLALVGIPYMDDVDVVSDSSQSTGAHQQNMQYMMWLNLSPHQRSAVRNIRLVCCCPTTLTHDEKAGGFNFVISDSSDSESVGYSLGAQARRLRRGAPINLEGAPAGLERYTEARAMFPFVMGDNKGLNEVENYSGNFGPKTWSICRHCMDIREAVAATELAGEVAGPIWRKWVSRLQVRYQTGTGFIQPEPGRGLLRNPDLFDELCEDVKALCAAGEGTAIPRLLQVTGAQKQINPETGEPIDHGYSGVACLSKHWDCTLPTDGMHDWPLGWSAQQGGGLISYLRHKGWASPGQLTDATCSHYRSLGERPPAPFKKAHYSMTLHPPNGCKATCKKAHVHVKRAFVVSGDTRLKFHAADSLHWVLHSIAILRRIPRVRQELDRDQTDVDPALLAWVLHVDVLSQLCAFRFERSALPRLERAVLRAVVAFKKVPEYTLLHKKAKLHFAEHIVTYISHCGPPRYWWCFRLEAKHQPLKALAVRSNFKNVSQSVAVGAMRSLAHWYSTEGRLPPNRCRKLVLCSTQGLTASAVATQAVVDRLLLETASWHLPNTDILHWEEISMPTANFKRGQTMVIRKGTPNMGLAIVCGVLQYTNRQNMQSYKLILHMHHKAITQPSEHQHHWGVAGVCTTLPTALFDAKTRWHALDLPLGRHHPTVELILVHLTPCVQRPDTHTWLVPVHSGHV